RPFCYHTPRRHGLEGLMSARRNEFAGAEESVEALMQRIGKAARAASAILANAPAEARNAALRAAAAELRNRTPALLAANKADLAAMQKAGATGAMIDRGTLDPARTEAVAQSL